MSNLGLMSSETQSDNPVLVSEHTLSVIAARDNDCNRDEVKVLGWWDVPEDHPDYKIGNTIYVQAIEVEYKIKEKPPHWPYGDYARAIYGVTDEGKIHLWSN